MEQVDHIAGVILELIRAIVNAIVVGLADGEAALRQVMAPLHLTPQVETLVLMVIALLILLLVLRLFGGVLRFLLAIVLILVVAQVVLPAGHAVTDTTPAPAPAPATPPQQQ